MKTVEARKFAASMIEESLEARIEELKQTDDFKKLCEDVQKIIDSPPENLSIDEFGALVSREDISLPATLCTDEEGNPDVELANAILEAAGDGVVYFMQDQYSKGCREWTAVQCMGEWISIDAHPERGCYAVFSEELGLKVESIRSEHHGILLAESAMRKPGVFPYVGRVDRYGCFFPISIPREVSRATDEELQRMIDEVEHQEEDAE